MFRRWRDDRRFAKLMKNAEADEGWVWAIPEHWEFRIPSLDEVQENILERKKEEAVKNSVSDYERVKKLEHRDKVGLCGIDGAEFVFDRLKENGRAVLWVPGEKYEIEVPWLALKLPVVKPRTVSVPSRDVEVGMTLWHKDEERVVLGLQWVGTYGTVLNIDLAGSALYGVARSVITGLSGDDLIEVVVK